MTKYKSLVDQLYKENQTVFAAFRPVHDLFAQNQKAYSAQFNLLGKPVMDLVLQYEKKLCAQMDGGKYGVYTCNLSEKFRHEIKMTYPYLDFIGVEFT